MDAITQQAAESLVKRAMDARTYEGCELILGAATQLDQSLLVHVPAILKAYQEKELIAKYNERMTTKGQ